MIDYFLQSVSEFHRVFKYRQPEPVVPDLSDAATNKLRPELIREELRETHEAWIAGNRVEILDGLCDLQYVIGGAVIAWGFHGFFKPSHAVPLLHCDVNDAFVKMFGWNAQMEIAAETGMAAIVLCDLVSLQDMLWRLVWSTGFMPVYKAAFTEVHRSNMSKLWKTPDYRAEGVYQMDATEGGWIARRGDGKIIKSPTYSPADLAKFVTQ